MSVREPRTWARSVVAVLARPWLWPTAVRVVGRSSRPGWWRRPPFLPRPPAAFVGFRLETQYGGPAAPAPADLVAYLTWCRSLDRAAGTRR